VTTAEQKVIYTADRNTDRQLKAKHRALWALGDYPAVAAELVSELGPELVRACGATTGHRVLDVSEGSGNAAIPAASAGRIVNASDLTPGLFDTGRPKAVRRAGDRARCAPGDSHGPLRGSDRFSRVLEAKLRSDNRDLPLQRKSAEARRRIDRDFLRLLTAWNHATEPGQTAYDAEFLLLTGIKR
jgi:SAM-dependent methyltransferase